MYKSFGAGGRTGAQGDWLSKVDSNLLRELGVLQQAEKTRKDQAARDISDIDMSQISTMAAAGSVADVERQVEQQRNTALYQAALQQVLFPYTTMSNIAQAMTNITNQGVVMGGGLTDVGFGVSALSGMFGSYYGAKAGAA